MNNIIIVINIILLEAILSIDNASVLATMVKHLKKEEQSKALKYWIFWAYFFRWICLLLVSFLLKITFLKLIGWVYLIYLTYKFFKWWENEWEVKTRQLSFWKTVLLVEIMDLTFSLDNIFAVVAITPNIWLIIMWVFIWILAMRFIANYFIILMNKFPFMEKSAYIVIGFLWIKLCLSYLVTLFWNPFFEKMINWHISDLLSSITTIWIFLFPFFKNYVLSSRKK